VRGYDVGVNLSTLVLHALTTLAQASEASAAKAIDAAPPGNHWLPIVVAVVLLLAVVGASFMSAKRGHQD
jgi:hypothetical protein